jgi:tRNA(Arg) A34 adenosine deaminase TadA
MKDHIPDKKFMESAINNAILGNRSGKYPIAAIVVKDNKIISKSYNGLPDNLDPTAHAEMLAMKKAAKKLNSRNLSGCILYSTNEPCAMCSAAVVWANMDGIVFGANVHDLENFWKKRRDEKTSKRKFIFIKSEDIISKSKPRIFIKKDFMRKECLKLFDLYDKDLRR